jgi:hypothetical protein
MTQLSNSILFSDSTQKLHMYYNIYIYIWLYSSCGPWPFVSFTPCMRCRQKPNTHRPKQVQARGRDARQVGQARRWRRKQKNKHTHTDPSNYRQEGMTQGMPGKLAAGSEHKKQTHTDPSKYRQEGVTQGMPGKLAAGSENKKVKRNTHRDPSKYRQEGVTQGTSGKPAAGDENKNTCCIF